MDTTRDTTVKNQKKLGGKPIFGVSITDGQ